MVKNKHERLPPNQVVFQVSPAMTSIDIKNYLEKIYKVPVYGVSTRNQMGEVKAPGFTDQDNQMQLHKDEDIKWAYVTIVSILLFYSLLC